MACNSGYDWCKEHDVVHRDGDKEYCVFHAHADKKFPHLGAEKTLFVEEFNGLVFAEIDRAKNTPLNPFLIEGLGVGDLSGTVFPGDISFGRYQGASSLPEVNFSHATFHGWTSFYGATFGDRADFISATFDRQAHFTGAKFNNGASFHTAVFGGEVAFGEAVFGSPQSDVGVDFGGAVFNKLGNFHKPVFNGISNFKELRIYGLLRFEEANIEKCAFLDTDLRKADFVNCAFPKKRLRFLEYLSERMSGWAGELFRRLVQNLERGVLYDEIAVFDRKGVAFSELRKEIRKVGDLYRRKKQKSAEEHKQTSVSHWHYNEKEMFRKESRFRRYWPLSFTNLYWASSGYGERPVRASIGLLVFVLLTFAFVCYGSLSEGWQEAGIAIDYLTFRKPDDFNTPGGFLGFALNLVSHVLVPIQAALFAFALRNRFRR